jgi:hypothetical protein
MVAFDYLRLFVNAAILSRNAKSKNWPYEQLSVRFLSETRWY